MIVLAFSFVSCATIFNNKQTKISAASGSAKEVTIMENGSVVYQGTLPAQISVNGRNTYTVQYKDEDGNSRTIQLQKRISGWFIADVLLFGGWIIDIITGDVMVYDEKAIIPISFNDTQEGLLVDYIPDDIKSDMRIIGNIYK